MPRRRNPNRRPLPRPGRPPRRIGPADDAWLNVIIGAKRPANDNGDIDPVDDLAQAVATARRSGIRWKDLVQRYGFSRTQLWKLCRAARTQEAGTPETGVIAPEGPDGTAARS